jgi:hypothetical protein
MELCKEMSGSDELAKNEIIDPPLGLDCRKQSARLCDDTILKLCVAHERGT